MARRHHKKTSENNLEWVGVPQCVGDSEKCALYFYNPSSTDQSTVEILQYGNDVDFIYLEHSRDGFIWNSITEFPCSLDIQAGEYLYLRSSSETPTSFNPNTSQKFYHISNSEPLYLGGNIKSLLCKYWNKDIPITSYCFANLFNAYYHSPNHIVFTQWAVGSSDPDHIDFVMPFSTLSDHCYSYMFRGVRWDVQSYPLNLTGSLTQATDGVFFLQGDMSTAAGCFNGMFFDCSDFFYGRQHGWINMRGITGTMPPGAFTEMFGNCTSMVLAQTVLDELDWYFGGGGISTYGMYSMFANCSNLVEFIFSSWSLTQYPIKYKGMYWDGNQDNYDDIYMDIYESKSSVGFAGMSNMFDSCSSLFEAWLPPYAVVDEHAYSHMYSNSDVTCLSYFHGNPILPAGIDYVIETQLITNYLGIRCYEGMFYGCTNLMEAPILPSMNLSNLCYREMFYNCTNILYIKMLGVLDNNNTYALNWLAGCTKSPVGAIMVVSGTSAGNNSWNISGESGCPSGWTMYNTYTEPLWIKNIGRTLPTISLAKSSSAPTIYVRWWTENNQITTNRTLSATTSTEIALPRWRRIFISASTSNNNSRFGGDSINYYWKFVSDMTTDLTSLAVGGQISTMLRYNGLANNSNIFDNSHCFQNMFRDLTVLQYAQELSVNNYNMLSGGSLPNYSYTYYSMFYGCTKLKYPPAHMGAFYSSGTAYRYQAHSMFYDCTSLRETPIISSTIVNINNCYRMFYCSTANSGHLEKITALFINEPSNTSIDADYGTYQWVQNQTQNGVFYKATDAEWDVIGVGSIPETFDVDVNTYRPKFMSYQPNWIYYLIDRKQNL